MLRSIFSLIQNIIDSDREYSNKKSKTVIYLVSTPDDNLNMDLEIDGQQRENIKSIRKEEMDDKSKNPFKITTEQGDMVTDRKITATGKLDDEKLIEEYKEAMEKYERITFTNDNEFVGGKKVAEDGKEFEMSEEVGVHDVWEKIPLKQMKPHHKGKFTSTVANMCKTIYFLSNIY